MNSSQKIDELIRRIFDDLKISYQLDDLAFQELLQTATSVGGDPEQVGGSSLLVDMQKVAFSLLMRHQGQRAHMVRTMGSVQIGHGRGELITGRR